MKKILPIILLISLRIFSADWSIHMDCPLEVKQPYNLKELNWSQGQTPLMAFDVTRKGRPESVDTNAIVRMIIGPSATNDYFAVTTNYTATGNSYYVQWPTIGTNTTDGVWWYTVYFEIDSHRYWSGNGDLYIEETTSTADGLVWQEITSNGGIASNAADIAINTADILTVSNQVQALDCAVTNISISAVLISNKTYTITITN